jgi:hypothetical protein
LRLAILNSEGEIDMQPKHFMFAALFAMATFASGAAHAVTIDTLTDMTPGTRIACDYTFQNGDPSIPCAQDIVAADGTVSFVKPNAPFDNIEYFEVVGDDRFPILTLLNPVNDPILPILTGGMEFPLLTGNTGGFTGFFDVFINLDPFIDGSFASRGTFSLGDVLSFSSGVNNEGFAGLEIAGYTGTAVVGAFNVVNVPEPSTLTLLLSVFLGLLWRRLASSAAMRRAAISIFRRAISASISRSLRAKTALLFLVESRKSAQPCWNSSVNSVRTALRSAYARFGLDTQSGIRDSRVVRKVSDSVRSGGSENMVGFLNAIGLIGRSIFQRESRTRYAVTIQ